MNPEQKRGFINHEFISMNTTELSTLMPVVFASITFIYMLLVLNFTFYKNIAVS